MLLPPLEPAHYWRRLRCSVPWAFLTEDDNKLIVADAPLSRGAGEKTIETVRIALRYAAIREDIS